MDHESWLDLITRYYDGCSSADIALMTDTLHPDVVHWFLAPNVGSTAVRGAEHLARYWRKVATPIQARWVVDSLCAANDQAVIEWSMFWNADSGDRVTTRGAEWFVARDRRIAEIRSYYQLQPRTTQLDGFPYASRGYSVPGQERTALHPGADRHGVST